MTDHTHQAVAPPLVHRTHDRDVFVRELRELGSDHFELTAIWPEIHPFYGPSQGEHDPLLVIETVREAGLLVGHVAYDIPLKSSFVTHTLHFDINPAGLQVGLRGPVVVEATAMDFRRRGRAVAGMRLTFVCRRDDVHIGTATFHFSCVSSAAYNKLRGVRRAAEPALPGPGAPLRPELVGRTYPIDVMLAEASDAQTWLLWTDPAHPVVYDHIMDHIPGNALIEAARQAAYVAIGRPNATVVHGSLSFTRYIEFDAPCFLSAEHHPATRTVHITFTQSGHQSAEANLELAEGS
jgi:2-oxo-3-(phosphooxy)propyl 3-oxoalkanoate synthase